jgi:hypothetical protein
MLQQWGLDWVTGMMNLHLRGSSHRDISREKDRREMCGLALISPRSGKNLLIEQRLTVRF